jgi:hypothetical protein
MGSFFKGIGRTNHCVIEYNGICYRQISPDHVLTEQDWNDSPATTGFNIVNNCECECILTTTAAPTSPSPTSTTSGPTTSTSSTSSPEPTSTTSGPTTIEGTTTTSGGTTTTGEPTTTTVCCPENSSTIISIEDFECEFIEFSDLEGSPAFITKGTIVRHDNVLYTFNPELPAYKVNGVLAKRASDIYYNSQSLGQYSPAYNNEFSLCCNLATTTSTIAPTTTTASYCDQQAALENPDQFRRNRDFGAFGNWKYPPCE